MSGHITDLVWVIPKNTSGVAYAVYTYPHNYTPVEFDYRIHKFTTRSRRRNGVEWFNSFKSEQAREMFLKEDVKSEIRRFEEAKTRQLSRMEERESNRPSVYFKVGDILSAEWGYEQTNINFAKVVAVGEKSIKIVEIGKIIRPGGPTTYSVQPEPGVVKGPVLTRVPNKDRVKLDSIITFYKWSGKPLSETRSEFGH